jgi:hypothetical protein
MCHGDGSHGHFFGNAYLVGVLLLCEKGHQNRPLGFLVPYSFVKKTIRTVPTVSIHIQQYTSENK